MLKIKQKASKKLNFKYKQPKRRTNFKMVALNNNNFEKVDEADY